MKSAPTLPLDIIETIVDILANDDGEGLRYVKDFSLTCQSFLPFCRKHIFSSVRIKLENESSRVGFPTGDAFKQLLYETPAIAKHVRQLIIRIIQRPHSDSEPGYSFDQVPQQLTRLHSLTISFLDLNDWNSISSSMQRSLLDLIHLPTLSHLGLRSIKNFPIFSLTTCSNLKPLSIGLYGSSEHDAAPPSLLHKPMRLQALDIEIGSLQTSRFLAARCLDGQPVLDITGLEKINIHFRPMCSEPWTDIALPTTTEIFRKAQQLTDIHLRVDDTYFRDMELAKTIAPSLQTLRRIELKIIIKQSGDLLIGLCEELEAISGKNILEIIDIQIDVWTGPDYQTSTEWGPLEKVLLNSGWPMLKRVSLVIIMDTWPETHIDIPSLRSLPQTQFTGLMSSKKLDFQFSVRGYF